jgi:hypothetical protein
VKRLILCIIVLSGMAFASADPCNSDQVVKKHAFAAISHGHYYLADCCPCQSGAADLRMLRECSTVLYYHVEYPAVRHWHWGSV